MGREWCEWGMMRHPALYGETLGAVKATGAGADSHCSPSTRRRLCERSKKVTAISVTSAMNEVTMP